MKNKLLPLFIGFGLATSCCELHAQSTAFTYQGQLQAAGAPANGNYDLRFALFDAASSGAQQGSTLTNSATAVSNGLFTVALDFGNQFAGADRWLELGVRTNGGGAFIPLAPRQKLTPTPEAIFAGTAGNATTVAANGVSSAAIIDGSIGNADINASAAIADTKLATISTAGKVANSATTANTTAAANAIVQRDGSGAIFATTVNGSFSGNGANVTNLNASQLGLGTVPLAQLSGITSTQLNAATWQLATNLNGGNAALASNLVAGIRATNAFITNSIFAGNGGGLTNLSAAQLTGALAPAQLVGTYGNAVTFNNPANSFSGNGGGLTNVNAASLGGLGAASFWKLLGNAGTASTNFLGTTDNQALELKVNNLRALRIKPNANGVPNLIGGSSNNFAGTSPSIEDTVGATIGGGDSNRIISTSFYGTIGGGVNNLIDVGSTNASIVGGNQNTITNATAATISGGLGNSVQAAYANVGGGYGNLITNNPFNPPFFVIGSTISGGGSNLLQEPYSSIGGGLGNSISAYGSAPFMTGFHTIGGGQANLIRALRNSTIGGGSQNTIATGGISDGATIGGGIQNGILGNIAGSTIGGGSGNFIDAYWGTVSGGYSNRLAFFNDYGVISGGSLNAVQSGSYASIAGGLRNVISTSYATIGGGASNAVSGNYFVTIGGGFQNSANGGFATIPGGAQAKALNYGQMAYASGQFAVGGDAQTSLYVARGTTANATPTELFLDGASARLVVPLNSTWTYDILLTARTSSGSSAGYQIRGVIENNSGTTALVGAPTVAVLAEDVVAWDATAIADNANSALVVRVTGAAATTIRWVASVRTVEVTN